MHHFNICSISCSGLVIVWRWDQFDAVVLRWPSEVCPGEGVCTHLLSTTAPPLLLLPLPMLTAAHWPLLTCCVSLCLSPKPIGQSTQTSTCKPTSAVCMAGQWSNPIVNPTDALWIGWQLQQCSGEFLKLCSGLQWQQSLQSKIRCYYDPHQLQCSLYWVIRAWFCFSKEFF